ncbi:hypothetical protein [Frankia sp. CeD]|uniref:hypothetical protein n=1 Tax=Frankia sp. CeD TaxID=258230 RepID=UPI0004DD4117|nr:hypothetical protein [Frankia sp. CeD]KEZ38576.1 hypothetical protein CEDDRAFT_00315 [Frankia sp. CeD]
MAYLNLIADTTGTLWYVPAWKVRRGIDLPELARRAISDDPNVSRVEILSDTREVVRAITRFDKR